MKKMLLYIFLIFCFSCEEEINPFEFDNSSNNNSDTTYFTDPTSFGALHNNIFSDKLILSNSLNKTSLPS